MPATARPALEVWSPLPPSPSGVADYVSEQLPFLAQAFDLTLVVEDKGAVAPGLRDTYRVVDTRDVTPGALRLYHVGNSPAHAAIYREALATPGIVVLHEWNLHELILGFGERSRDFTEYTRAMRREHGERGAIAADALSRSLGGAHWAATFPLNAEILERSLAVVALAGSTAERAASRLPGGRVLRLPHHALLVSHATTRLEARARLGLDPHASLVVAPGLGTTAKALDVARAAMQSLKSRFPKLRFLTVGGGGDTCGGSDAEIALGRVDLETLGDVLLAADVVLALRFPSRGEASGVVMRALAAGRAVVVTSGSTADEDLADGVVARVNPGPSEAAELAATTSFLLEDTAARERLERLALHDARKREVAALTRNLVVFVQEVATSREDLETQVRHRTERARGVRPLFRDAVEAAGRSLGLFQLPPRVFEKLASL